MRYVFVVVVLLPLLAVSPSAAQTIVNPTRAMFTASADHNAVWTDNSTTPPTTGPMVDHYELQFSLMAGTFATVFTQNILKPTPGAGNTITVQFATFPTLAAFANGLPKNTLYSAKVAAVNLAGATASPVSNPFVNCPCSPALPPQAPGSATFQ